jgi:dCMP deaminase
VTRPTWDETRIKMARDLGWRSLCDRDQVGALITDAHGKVIGEGYNGPPSGFDHKGQRCTQWCRRNGSIGTPKAEDYSDCPALHAEANALMMSDRALRAGGTIYVTSHICFPCAKLIANSGLIRVVVDSVKTHEHRNSEASYEFLTKCRLHVFVNGRRVYES